MFAVADAGLMVPDSVFCEGARAAPKQFASLDLRQPDFCADTADVLRRQFGRL